MKKQLKYTLTDCNVLANRITKAYQGKEWFSEAIATYDGKHGILLVVVHTTGEVPRTVKFKNTLEIPVKFRKIW